MNKVITVNLNGNPYQIEESGYQALCAYLEHAEAQLKGNPDRTEIMADFEQAIAEKCSGFLSANKRVVTEAEIGRIIAEMGPVDDAAGERTDKQAYGGDQTHEGDRQGSGPRKRLYRIRDGAMLAGVCTGVAANLNIDVTIVRILFLVLTILTHGAWILVYVVLSFVIPYADTSEQHAAAYGMPFNAQEFINQAKENFEDIKSNGKKLKWQLKKQQREWRRAWRRTFRNKYQSTDTRGTFANGAGPVGGLILGVLGMLMGMVALFWVIALVSLVNTGSAFGWSLPDGMPLWMGLLILVAGYSVISLPLKAARSAVNYNYGVSNAGLMEVWSTVLWLGVMSFAVWFCYNNVPEVHYFIRNVVTMLRELSER